MEKRSRPKLPRAAADKRPLRRLVLLGRLQAHDRTVEYSDPNTFPFRSYVG